MKTLPPQKMSLFFNRGLWKPPTFEPWKQTSKSKSKTTKKAYLKTPLIGKQKRKKWKRTIFHPRLRREHRAAIFKTRKEKPSQSRSCSGHTLPSSAATFTDEKSPGIFIFFQRRLCRKGEAIERSLSRRERRRWRHKFEPSLVRDGLLF
jgi:hypothetical protein